MAAKAEARLDAVGEASASFAWGGMLAVPAAGGAAAAFAAGALASTGVTAFSSTACCCGGMRSGNDWFTLARLVRIASANLFSKLAQRRAMAGSAFESGRVLNRAFWLSSNEVAGSRQVVGAAGTDVDEDAHLY